jgi:hypothetical protein
VVLKPGAQAGEKELIDHVRSTIAHYKAPKAVAVLDEMPKHPHEGGALVARRAGPYDCSVARSDAPPPIDWTDVREAADEMSRELRARLVKPLVGRPAGPDAGPPPSP